MNCKWAEGYLSACLDGTLDPAVRDEVVEHVEACAQCSAILNDYRRYDALVGSLPRYEPAEELRERIFGSPEFAALVESLDGYGDRADVAPAAPLPHPITLSRLRPDEREGRGAVERTPAALPGRPLAAARERATEAEPARSGAPSWTRGALAAAAVLALALGSGLLASQSLWHATANKGHGVPPVGGLQNPPLAAGSRVVYERDGALWSAPEHGPGLARQLTPSGVVIDAAGWAVAPIRSGSGGRYVAYIDLKTGQLHIVRSDDQRDRSVGQAAPREAGAGAAFWSGSEGQAILAGLSWSPDGSHLAYLADAGSEAATALWVTSATGGSPEQVPTAAGATYGPAVWSPDGLRIAYVQTSSAGQSIWDYNVAARQALELSSAAEPGGASGAVVGELHWLPASAGPGVTWTSSNPARTSITGLFTGHVGGVPQRLVAGGSSYAVASYSPARDGAWLLGNNSALYLVSAQSPGVVQQGLVTDGVRALAWAPDGSAAALISGKGSLWLWSRGSVMQVAGIVAAQAGLVSWSPDSAALAFVTPAQGQITVVQLIGGTAGTPRILGGVSGATWLAWAPDAQRLAIATPAGVVVVGASGGTISQVDTHTAASQLVWSVAG
jgi:Tol biopolymer transport system component